MYIPMENENVLRIRKIKQSDAIKPIIGENQKESYNKFLTEGVYRVFDNICEILSKKFEKEITCKLNVEKEPRGINWKRELKKRVSVYYPVKATFTVDGVEVKEVEVLRIPYADEFNILNVDGSRKVAIGEIKSLETISFKHNPSKQRLEVHVSLPRSQITLHIRNKDANFVFRKSNVNASEVIEAAFDSVGDLTTVNEMFQNAIIRKSMPDPSYASRETISENIANKGILNAYKQNIGTLREELDNLLSLDIALGETLADDIELPITGGVIKAGSVISKQHIKQLNKNGIFRLNIKAIPLISGTYLQEDVKVTKLYQGTPVKDIITKAYPETKDMRFLDRDMEVSYTFEEGTKLDPEKVELMYYGRLEGVNIRTTKTYSGDSRYMPFKQEILSNHTAPVLDLTDNISKAFTYQNKSVYTYGQEDLSNPEDIAMDYLTPHDLAALVSYSIHVFSGRVKDTFNRDKDFVKKINLINETFSEALMTAFRNHLSMFNKSFVNEFTRNYMLGRFNHNPFESLSKEWISGLIKTTILREEEDYNPLSLLSQTSRVVSLAQGKNSVSDDLRTLALPFYGRICPYETPAGKTIGLVNTLTIGCKVVNTIPKTPYHRIVYDNGKYRLSSDITWLSSREEQSLTSKDDIRIGDLMSLTFDDDGYLVNTKVLARIPAPSESDERMSVATVESHSLSHVNVLAEQHLSPTAMMIPFAASDDGARVAFGLSLMKQSRYVHESEVPWVTTSMYKDIYNFSGYFIKKAKKDGYVVEIGTNNLKVKYNDGTDEIIDVDETRVSNNCLTVMNYNFGKGEEFKEGDILVDSSISKEGFFSPGINCLVGYICADGWNYEDAIVGSVSTAQRITSLGTEKFENNLRIKDGKAPRVIPHNQYRYVKEGDVIATAITIRPNDVYTKANEQPIISDKSGILYSFEQEQQDGDDALTITAKFVNFNKLQSADKLAGRHGNKGVDSIILPDSQMPCFMNGVPLDMMLNPSGVVSRMNIGQMSEAHLGFCGYMLGMRMESDPFNGASLDEVAELHSFVWHCSNMDNMSQVRDKFGKRIPEFVYSRAEERWDFMQDWKGCFNENGTAKLYNPETGTYFENDISFGMAYMLKTIQEVDHKLHVREGVLGKEPYSLIDKQPPKGSSKGGGQRVGEMEFGALAAHGATAIMDEMMNIKSDNVPMRVNMAMEMVDQPPLFNESEYIPRSVDLFRYQLEASGVYVDIPTEVYPGIRQEDVELRRDYDSKAIARRAKSRRVEDEVNYKDIMKELDEMEDLE